jgi:hypothetical protein
MPVWSEPQNLKTWVARGVSFRGTVLVLVVVATLISEVRFSWVEVLVGRYLAVTNSFRPESGSVWEQGHLKAVATQTLEQLATRQLTAQREARQAATLAQLIDGLSPSRGTMISAAQFKSLYSKLPDAVARKLFSPIFMLRISAEKSWERVYFEREDGQVGIYLLDHGNNVLSYAMLNDQQLSATDTQPSVLAASLDDRPEFAGRIYGADRFFTVLDKLSPEIQRGVLPQPEAVLANEGTPLRVGISDEVNADMIRIGIEMDTPQGRRVLQVMGQEWAVWQVRLLLEPQISTPSSGKRRRPLRRRGER